MFRCPRNRVNFTANSFSSLSMDPPLVLWSIAHTSRSSAAFKNAKHFAVNILAVEQVEYSQRFATPAQNKFEEVDWRSGVLGSPILPNVLASLECALETTLHGGDHVILIGRVKKYSRYAGNALLYAQGRYAVAEDHPSLQLKPSNLPKAGAELNVSDMRLMALLAYVEMYASDAFDKYRQSQGLNIAQSRILFALSGGNQLSLEEIVARSFLLRDSRKMRSIASPRGALLPASGKRLLSQKAAATCSRGFLFSWTNSKSSNLAAYCRTLQSRACSRSSTTA